MDAAEQRSTELTRLAGIVDRLREGCPWDREQTLASMAPCAQEEAAEVADAVAAGREHEVREELGDLLMNVFLMARIAEQEGKFTLADVAREIGDKLVRRHPHVFGDATARDPQEALANWDRIKQAEKREKATREKAAAERAFGEKASGDEIAPESSASVLDAVPERLSSLGRALKLGAKAARVGFDWPDAGGAFEKAREELDELAAARGEGRARLESELGDLLFAVVNVARKLALDPDMSLRGACARFERRFRHLERKLGPRLKDAKLEEMERLWQEAKASGL